MYCCSDAASALQYGPGRSSRGIFIDAPADRLARCDGVSLGGNHTRIARGDKEVTNPKLMGGNKQFFKEGENRIQEVHSMNLIPETLSCILLL